VTPDGPAPARPGQVRRSAARWSWVAVVASLALLGTLWTLHVSATGRAAGLFHDEGVYLVTARALATGGGYRRVGTPGAPPEVRYPPLLPLVLSAVWRLAPRFPDNLPFLKGVCLLAAVGLVLVLPGYLESIGLPAPVAAVTAVLTAIAPLTIRYATVVASELPFALLALLALWLTERSIRTDRGLAGAALAGVVAALSFLTRTVGAAVIAAGLVMLLRRADRRRATAFALTAGLGALPWVAWLALQGGHGGSPGYLAAFLNDGPPHPAELLAHLAALPAAIGLVTIPGLADLLSPRAPLAALAVVYASGFLILVWTLRQPFGTYVVLTLAAAVAVPWFQPRFLVPLSPLFLATLLAHIMPPATGRPRTAVIALLGLLVGALVGNRIRLEGVRASGIPALEEATYEGGRWQDLEAAFAWLRATTGPGDVLASFHDPVLYLYTGRPTVQAYPSLWRPAAEQVSAAIARGRARYVVDLPCPESGVWADARAAWQEWIATHAGSLTLVYAGDGGRVRVWRLGNPLDAEDVDGTGRAEADHVSQADPSPRDLSRPGRSAQM
jgi:hypothetical protein